MPVFKGQGEFQISKLNVGSEILSQKFSKPGIKISHQGKELCSHMRRDLRKVTVTLEQVRRELKENKCQRNEMKYMYQKERSQNYNCMEEQKSIHQRLSQIESKITWLLHQFQGIHKKFDDKDAENSGLQLGSRYVELMNENQHFKERSNQYKKKKSKREVSIKPDIWIVFKGEFSDT